jgi:hypothetical protein
MGDPVTDIIPKGYKLCKCCGGIKPEREFTGNQCYDCVKPKRDQKYFRYKETHFL